MKTITIKNSLALTAVTLVLTACGSSSSDSDEALLGAALPQGQTDSAINTPFVAITDEELGELAEVPDTQTASLQVFDDFTFDTARRTNVALSIPEATAVNAEATFCTDYSLEASGDYDVNYDSCVLSAPLLGGELNEDLDLVNQHSSVLGIVWFEDEAMLPMYQEFHFD